jgi:hypothetical protein
MIKVQTQHKTVWLGGYYLEPGEPVEFSLVASTSSKGLYHDFRGSAEYPETIGCIPAPPETTEQPPAFPLYNPPALTNHPLYLWTCTRASLKDVQRVRKSTRGGVELQYEDFSVCLGDFRISEAQVWVSMPAWLVVSRTNNARHNIDFYTDNDGNVSERRRMEGDIIMWICQEDVIIQLE